MLDAKFVTHGRWNMDGTRKNSGIILDEGPDGPDIQLAEQDDQDH